LPSAVEAEGVIKFGGLDAYLAIAASHENTSENS
jgi:hypothetical protein